MALSSRYAHTFFFQTHFRSFRFKGFPARDASNSESTSYHNFAEKNYWASSERFTSITYGFHFWIGSQSVGITFTIQFFQVQLDWSRRNLSLPIEHLFWIRFRRSAKLSGFHLFCVNLLLHDLRFALQYESFRFLNLLFLVCWLKTSSLHVKWRCTQM